MGHGRLSLGVIEHGHVAGRACDRADREAAADDLGQGHQIRFQIENGMRPAISQPEGYDLVHNEKDAEPVAALLQDIAKLRGRRHHAGTRRQRIEQNGRQPMAVLFQDLSTFLRFVETQDDRVRHDRRRRSCGVGDTGRPVLAPVEGCRIEADLHMIVGAVVGALELGDGWPAGDGARGLDGEHHSLGAGVHETALFQSRCASSYLLGQVRFAGQRQSESRSPIDGGMQRIHHWREGVAMDQREEVVGAVENAPSVDVGDPRP